METTEKFDERLVIEAQVQIENAMKTIMTEIRKLRTDHYISISTELVSNEIRSLQTGDKNKFDIEMDLYVSNDFKGNSIGGGDMVEKINNLLINYHE